MRSLLTLVLLIASPSLYVVDGICQQQPATKPHESGKKKSRPAQGQSAQPVHVIVDTVPEQTESQRNQSKAEQDARERGIHAQWSAAKAAWLGLWIGIINAAILIGTLIATYRAATAAKLNAIAAIRAERAWIIARVINTPGYSPETEKLQLFETTSWEKSKETEATAVTCRLTWKNNGRTPARIIEKRARLKIAKRFSPEPNIDKCELLGSRTNTTEVFLAPDEDDKFDFTLKTDGRKTTSNRMFLYGAIRYRDMMSDQIRESRFGYEIFMGGNYNRIEGYPQYNQND